MIDGFQFPVLFVIEFVSFCRNWIFWLFISMGSVLDEFI